MAEIWKAGDEVYKTMEQLIANKSALSHLALVDDEILLVFREKAATNGDMVIAGATAKAGPLLTVVSEGKKWQFVITLAADTWATMGSKEQEALLFHHLCACAVDENPTTGDTKCSKRLPDVSFYREEVEEYGFWRTTGTVPEPDLIDELFGAAKAPAP